MIRIQLHLEGVIYGGLSWKERHDWELGLVSVPDVNQVAQDIHAWCVATNTSKLRLVKTDADLAPLINVLESDFGFRYSIDREGALLRTGSKDYHE